jgi:polyhydroxybutyrate depolymerase
LKLLLLTICLVGISSLTAAQVVRQDSLVIESYQRSFVTVADSIQPGASIFFVLHGSGGNAAEMRTETKMLELVAKKSNIILVYPNGYKTFWNECRKASTAEANLLNINEQAFFKAMINHCATNFKADTNKVFVIGYSGGGHMAFKLAQTMPQAIKGIATICSNLPTPDNNDCAVTTRPLKVMLINGTADDVSPYNGGLMNTGNLKLGTVQSVQETLAYWVKVNGISKKPKTFKTIIPQSGATEMVITSYQQKRKQPVVLYTIVGGKHNIPKGLDAFVTAWTFFK